VRNLFKWRQFILLPVIALLSAFMLADNAGAVLRSDGSGVLVNRTPPPTSTVLFSGDLIETQQTAVARIEASGSAVNINSQTLVQFEGDELVLEHGGLSVNTTRGLRVRVGCLVVVPQNTADWTHYEVADVDGKVTVSAIKSNVDINSGGSKLELVKHSPSIRLTVLEGEQKSRDDKCGAEKTLPASPADGPSLNSPWAVGAGAVGIGVLICFALCRGGVQPISPSQP
jgi:hypothetical protein